MTRNKRVFLYVGITFALLALIWAVIFISAANSEPFEKAVSFIKGSSEVRQSVGEVTNVTLAFLKPFSFHYSDVRGAAQFECDVVGTAGKATMYVQLEKRGGEWHVAVARLNGRGFKAGQKLY